MLAGNHSGKVLCSVGKRLSPSAVSKSSGSVVAPLPFLYQCVGPGNPAIVTTKLFVFLNDFLHNRLLNNYKLPGGSYYDVLLMSLERISIFRTRSYS